LTVAGAFEVALHAIVVSFGCTGDSVSFVVDIVQHGIVFVHFLPGLRHIVLHISGAFDITVHEFFLGLFVAMVVILPFGVGVASAHCY
jgi:hypothetical protein